MKHFYDIVIDTTGKGVSGATVTVNVHGGGLATIYSDDGSTTTANPVTTDSAGRFNFYVADGRYDLVVASGTVNYTQSDVEISDITEGASTDAAWNVQSGGLKIKGSSSGTVTLAVPAAAGSNTTTFQAANDTVVYKATADTLTNKTLTSPTLTSPTITNPSTTGTDSGAETLVNKTLTAPVITNPSTTGTDSGAETLQNKTLTGASSGNSVTLLNAQGNAAALTGNGAAQDMFTYTLPANTVATLKGIRVKVWFSHSTGTASVVYNFQLNGQGINTIASSVTGTHWAEFVLLSTANTTGTAYWTLETTATATQQGTVTGLSFSTNQVLHFTFSVANTDQVTPGGWLVELIQ